MLMGKISPPWERVKTPPTPNSGSTDGLTEELNQNRGMSDVADYVPILFVNKLSQMTNLRRAKNQIIIELEDGKILTSLAADPNFRKQCPCEGLLAVKSITGIAGERLRVWLACEHPMPMKREMEQPWEATPGAALWVSLPSEVNNFML
ncbi:hypothetical protein TURU_168758 [Turdus rufiventris]|nr:hypothetical protein TURU_168758 [Turdus rufiventris]